MPSRHHFSVVAKHLKERLNGKAFLTIPRMEITQAVRDISGEEATRIKAAMGSELERALLEQGVRCHPSLAETTTDDTIRLFHAGSLLGSLVDLLVYPSPETDKDLGAMLSKIKGKWKWATPTGPGAHFDPDVAE